jgi:hypothetical protein
MLWGQGPHLTYMWHKPMHKILRHNAVQSSKRQSTGDQAESKTLCLLSASHWFIALLTLQLSRWKWQVLLKCLLTLTRLHSVVSHSHDCENLISHKDYNESSLTQVIFCWIMCATAYSRPQ